MRTGLTSAQAIGGFVAGCALLLLMLASVISLPISVTVALPLAVAATYGSFTYPRETLVLALAGRVLIDLTWWAPGAFGVNNNELYSAGYALLAACLLLLYIRTAQRFFFFVPLLFFCVPMLAGALQDTLWLGVGLRTTAEFFARLVSPVIVMILAGTIVREDYLRRATIYAVPIAALGPIVVGVYHYMTGQMYQTYLDGYFRLLGGYANLHNHAHSLALFLCFGPLLFFGHKNLVVRGFALSFSATCLFLMMMTHVRTTQVGIAVFLLVFLVAGGRWLTLSAFALVAVPMIFRSDMFQDRFGEILAFATGDVYADTAVVGSGRFDLWSVMLEDYLGRSAFQQLFGAGAHGATREYGGYFMLDAHSDYLALIMMTGPLGLVLYLYFQLALTRMSLVVLKTSRSIFWRNYGAFMLGLNAMVFVTNVLSNSYVSRFSIGMVFWTLGGILAGKYASLTGTYGFEPEVETEEPEAVASPAVPAAPWGVATLR